MPGFRPRLTFSLRTLLALVTLLCVWLGYQLHWIRQRSEALASGRFADLFDKLPSEVRAPGLLWLFGERGHAAICVLVARDPSGQLMPVIEADLARAKELFPEANIWHELPQPAAASTSSP